MVIRRSLIAALVCWLAPGTGVTQSVGSPLFEDSEPIAITLTAQMRDLVRNRRSKEPYDAVMQFTDASGVVQDIAVTISARGNSRLKACDFPPLRLEINRQLAEETVFAGQRRLKMVTQCNNKSISEDWLSVEYGIYRAYNVITDYSFRVRRLDVTFREPDSRYKRMQQAFVIEPIGVAAKRLERKAIRPPSVDYNQLDAQETAYNTLFQYLIANTDFAIKRGPKGEGCCHNGRIVAPDGKQTDWVHLPYDFDQAGLIETDYAAPDERFGIPDVRTRVYRGFCWHNDELANAITLFNDRRGEIVAALLPDGVSKYRIRHSNRYFDRFYNTINDKELLQKQLLDKCRGPESLPIRESTVMTN